MAKLQGLVEALSCRSLSEGSLGVGRKRAARPFGGDMMAAHVFFFFKAWLVSDLFLSRAQPRQRATGDEGVIFSSFVVMNIAISTHVVLFGPRLDI